MSTLHRSQVYIPEEMIALLKLEAKKDGLTVSELIREAIQNLLSKKSRSVNWDNDPFTKAVGKFKSDVTDASTNHDFYLYGGKKKG